MAKCLSVKALEALVCSSIFWVNRWSGQDSESGVFRLAPERWKWNGPVAALRAMSMCTLPIESLLHSMRSPQKEEKEKKKKKSRTRRPFCHDSSSRLEES